jgi:hypothetical protein
MEPLHTQRRHQVGAHSHSGPAPTERPAHPHALMAAAGAGHRANVPVSAVASLQRSIGNRAVTGMLTGQPGSGTAPLVQRAGADATKPKFPDEVISEHVGTEPMPGSLPGISLLNPASGSESANTLGQEALPQISDQFLKMLPQ